MLVEKQYQQNINGELKLSIKLEFNETFNNRTNLEQTCVIEELNSLQKDLRANFWISSE